MGCNKYVETGVQKQISSLEMRRNNLRRKSRNCTYRKHTSHVKRTKTQCQVEKPTRIKTQGGGNITKKQ